MARKTLRQRWLQIHLWIALIAGLFIALLGLTGACLVIKTPILELEIGKTALYHNQQSAGLDSKNYIDDNQLKASVKQHYPQLEKIMGVALPNSGFIPATNSMVFGNISSVNKLGIAFLDPYTASPRGFVIFDDLFFAKIVSFHRALLLPFYFGSLAVFGCGFLLLLSLLSGLILWWPKKGQLRRSLAWQANRKGIQWWRQWHNIAAIYLYIPLFIITLSGCVLAQPQWFSVLSSLKPFISALHAELALGLIGHSFVGKTLAFVAGIALFILYLSGCAMWGSKWWKKKQYQKINRH